jgi:hypothetical protein
MVDSWTGGSKLTVTNARQCEKHLSSRHKRDGGRWISWSESQSGNADAPILTGGDFGAKRTARKLGAPIQNRIGTSANRVRTA